MVSTRSHPSTFPDGDMSPSKSPSKRTNAFGAYTWSHVPNAVIVAWLAISLPLVVWDFMYIFLRPYSMPGGAWHAPIWSPYAYYVDVDYVYGFPALEAGSGFPAAQSALNAVETALYAVYLAYVYRGHKVADAGVVGRKLVGRDAALAVTVGFAAAVGTVSKTVLYWLIEYFGAYSNIGHNEPWTLFWLWIVPNGLWLLFPAYMIYILGGEIVDGLETAAGRPRKKVL
ncbi:hypothetical protein EJ06DRAFT_510154 [Trichodelitschia bisporula]|uniref:C6 transcription factor n=1 Tax=Trichodelitschia bisporula TaxID=703511 RepID=A0A6G1HVU7_9PEZI|nr:hypothetical protein EJ06DRAFT_510154 [Trichodelitschia bisporula]